MKTIIFFIVLGGIVGGLVGFMVDAARTNERTLFRAWTNVHNAPLTFEEFTVLHKEGLLPE